MRLVIIILSILISIDSTSQRSLPVAFNLNTQATQSAYEIEGHTGTTIIRGKKFTNSDPNFQWGDCLWIDGGSGTIIIENCTFENAEGVGIETENFNGTLIIRNCFFINVRGGAYIVNNDGTTIFEYNEVVNPHNLNRPDDTRAGRGQAAQLRDCSGTIRVRYNRGRSYDGEGYTEDWISFFNTTGSSGNPALIEYNVFWGGGPSESGGGIMTGDHGGGWTVVRYNDLLDVGNYGLAASGGDNITITLNRYYQPERDWSNVGGYAFNNTGPCSNITFTNNNVYCNSARFPPTNHYYLPTDDGGQCTGRTYSGNVSTINEAGLNIPARFIRFIDPPTLFNKREASTGFQIYHVSGGDDEYPGALHRPVTVVENDKTVFTSFTTITSSGSSSTNGYNYQWIQESGPNTATLSNATTATLSVTNMTGGVYVFRLIITDNDGSSSSDIITLTNIPT